MTATARARQRRRARGLDVGGHGIGEEALHLTRWFAKSKYHLMGQFLGELERAPEARDPAVLRDRFCRAITHAHRVHRVRGIVTLLLSLGIVAAATSSVLNALDVVASTRVLDRAAAFSASASIVLIAVRLLLDRYLERADVAATFLAIEIAAAHSGAAASRSTPVAR